MDLKTPERRNFNISEQLNERIPIEKWSLLKSNRNDFNFGKKSRQINGRNDRILNWEQPSKSQFSRKQYENQQMKRQNREIIIPRPIKYRKHLLPFQKNPPVRVNVSCFNLPKSLFSSALLGITPQKNINDTEKTFASNFFPQITSTPLPCDDLFSNQSAFNSGKPSSLQSYAEFLSSIQIPLNKSKGKLFLNNITDNILTSLRTIHRASIPAPQSDQELIRTEAADVLSQKRAKLTFLRKGRNRNLQNAYSTFTLSIEDDQEPIPEFLEHTGIFPRKEPSSPDFMLSPFWFQQAANTPASSLSSLLPINNQLTEDLRHNLDMNEVLSNFTNTSTSYYRDQYFNLEWKNESFPSLNRKVQKSNCEDFAAYNPLIQNPDCGISKSPSLILPQKDFNRLLHDDDDITSQLTLTDKRFSKGKMKRRREPQYVVDETNLSWKRSLLDESLQTNSSEIIRSIDHLIKQSPDVKPKNFNIYEKSKWD